MLEPSNSIRDAVRAAVMRDLDPPARLAHAKAAVAFAVGGLASLLVCGQFGFGLTPFARALHGTVMTSSGSVACMAFCGLMFAAFPVSLLRALCSPLQFRAIMRRRPLGLAAWLLGVELVLASHAGFVYGLLSMAIWFATAAAAMAALAGGIWTFDKKARFPA